MDHCCSQGTHDSRNKILKIFTKEKPRSQIGDFIFKLTRNIHLRRISPPATRQTRKCESITSFFVFVLLREQKIPAEIPSRNFIPFEPQKSVPATLKLISYILKTKHTVSAKVLMQHNVWLKFRVFYLNVFWFQTKILKYAFKDRTLIRDWNLCFTRQV